LAIEGKVAGLRLRALTSADLATAHALSRAVHWPHRLDDWRLAMSLGRGHVAELDGEAIGTALCWRFGRAQAALGMVIVDPRFQGCGIGRSLMRAALKGLGNRSVLLRATGEGRRLYEQLGFVALEDVSQHQGKASGGEVVGLAKGERLRPTGRRDGAGLAALDARASGIARHNMLAALLGTGSGVVLDRDGEAIGFALLRRSGRGYVIGPVIAPDSHGAKALIAHWIGRHAGAFVRIDVPAACGLGDWLAGFGLQAVDTVSEMVRGHPPRNGTTVRRFALANQAFG
jgi:predicted N-acetyltransferase YhbS